MNVFSFVEERIATPGVELTHHLAPWDRPIFGANTAVISSILCRSDTATDAAFDDFRTWCETNDVKLVSCRLAMDQLVECGFLEAHGFRFIELNYRPVVVGLDRFAGDPGISIGLAESSDEPEISSIARQIFEVGRLHVDPQVGAEIGNRRYAAWVANAFANPGQQVLKCLMNGRLIAFMVIEQPTPDSRFWSLVGLAPGLAGQGLGRRVWNSMLAFHHHAGVREVSTSISSHNVAVHNLYVSLGFRFPAPGITLHWCPFGPLTQGTQ